MDLNETYPNFNEKLAEALKSVGFQEGIVGYDGFGIVTDGKHLNNYLLAARLARMIEDGDVELKFNPDKTDYLLRLLGLKKRGE